ncbi:unnamed protein product, partial [Prorocentrum cordatum]
ALDGMSVRAWEPLDEFEVRVAMGNVAGSSAGPDGWTGTELAGMVPMVQAWDGVLQRMQERRKRLPTSLSEARQVHLPKAAGRDSDGAMEVEAMRPVTIFSCFCRCWASARLRSTSCPQWTEEWWPSSCRGAKRGASVWGAAAVIAEQMEAGAYGASQDCSMCFDCVDPWVAEEALRLLGVPGGQRIILGGPWSPLALTAVLAGPFFEAHAAAPWAEFALFVGDRTPTAPALPELFKAAEVLLEWTSVLGLKKNEGKRQLAAATPSKRRQLLQLGSPADRVRDELEVLGAKFTGGPKRVKMGKGAPRKLAQGPRLDVARRAQQATVMAVVRTAAKTRPSTTPTRWERGRRWGGNVAAMLKTTGWALTGERAWRRAGLDERASLGMSSRGRFRPNALAHVLQEGWRRACFVQWQRVNGIEAAQAAAAIGMGAAASLAGAVVPPAALGSSRARRAAQAGDEAQPRPRGGAPAWPAGERRRADGVGRVFEWAIHVRGVAPKDRRA